jgi:hypothetical protein
MAMRGRVTPKHLLVSGAPHPAKIGRVRVLPDPQLPARKVTSRRVTRDNGLPIRLIGPNLLTLLE